MNMPWMSRSAHQEITAFLTQEVGNLRAERRLLLDRLAVLGLGAPLYSEATEPAVDSFPLREEEVAEDSDGALEEMLRLRRRPAKLADVLTRRLRRAESSQMPGPRVAWIPEGDAVTAALDHAEELGRRRA